MNKEAIKIFIIRFFSIAFLLLSTVLLLFLQKNGLFDYFAIENRGFVVAFVLAGIFFTLLGLVLGVKTIQQFKTSKELLSSVQETRGIYNNVRNPVYSSVFLTTGGILLTRHNFILAAGIGLHWLVLNVIIFYTEEKRLIKKRGIAYLQYTLHVSPLIPWFNQAFQLKKFNQRDQLYLENAAAFLNKEITAPVMGIYFTSFSKMFWFRKGVCFATEEEIGFYSYGLIRGHYCQMISFKKISSFAYGRSYLGYSLRFYASSTSVNLYFIQKGEFEQLINLVKEQLQ